MPDITTFDTMELLALIETHVAQAGQAAFNELKSREIKENDPEDAPDTRGGIRPKKHSIVP